MGTVVWPKIPKMPLHFSAQFVCPSPKFRDFREKALSGCLSVVQLKQALIVYVYALCTPCLQATHRKHLAKTVSNYIPILLYYSSWTIICFIDFNCKFYSNFEHFLLRKFAGSEGTLIQWIW